MLFLEKLALLLSGKRRSRESSFEEELRSHLEMAEEEAVKNGATAEEAAFTAKRDLGSLLRIQETARSVWGFATWEQLTRDCIYSLRILGRAPSFTFGAVLSLGIGIGAATAIFSLLNTILLKPLSYRRPGQLVLVREVVAPLAGTYPSMPVNYQHFLFWREHTHSFESLAAIESGIDDLTDRDPIKVGSAYVSTNLFSMLGVQPQFGRSFLPEEGQKGRAHVVLISDAFWSSRFGRAPDLVGKSITIDYVPYMVIGVLPASFRFPKNDELGPLVSLNKDTALFMPLTGSYSNGWGGDYDYAVLGRVKSDISVRQATAELDMLEHQIDTDHHLSEGLTVLCSRLQDVMVTPVRTPLYVLMSAVMLLLLMVCVNLANLVLARSSVRFREFSIRAALGAGQARLIRQVLVETCTLGIAGGVMGLGLAALALHAFVSSTSLAIPRLDEVRIEGHVFLFSLLVSLACGLVAGLAPAIRIARIDSQESLRAGSHAVAGNRESLRIREILIAAEVAMSVVLLFGAGLMTSSLARLLSIDKGFTAEQALAVTVDLPYVHYRTSEDDLRFWDRSLQELRTIPGIESAAFASKLPLTGESMVNDVVLEGTDSSALDPALRTEIMINVRYVSPEYFNTLGIPLIKGRAIEPADRHRAVAVISERLASKLWAGQNPLGKKLSTGADVGKVEVVGVVKDVHATTLDSEPTLMLYVPYWHNGFGSGTLVLRVAGGVNAIPAIRKRLHSVDPSLPPPNITTIASLVSDSLSRRYFQVRLAAAFACAAVALALIGIYGVVVYHVAMRRTEVAVRLALGASRMDVFQLLFQSGFRPLSIGLAIGVTTAIGSGQLIRGMLFHVRAYDPLTMLLVVALLAAAAFLACVAPLRRATRTDPAIALRYE